MPSCSPLPFQLCTYLVQDIFTPSAVFDYCFLFSSFCIAHPKIDHFLRTMSFDHSVSVDSVKDLQSLLSLPNCSIESFENKDIGKAKLMDSMESDFEKEIEFDHEENE